MRYDLKRISAGPGPQTIEWFKDGVVVRRLDGDAAAKHLRRGDLLERLLSIVLLPVAVPYAHLYWRRQRKLAAQQHRD